MKLKKIWTSRFGTVLRGAHTVAKGLLSVQGFEWHVRRNGEMQIGYWKKSFHPRGEYPFPKRFVLIPGFGDSSLSWMGVVFLLWPLLKKNFDEVIVFDFPGFGGILSRKRAFPSMDLMISSVFDALDSFKPHTLFGHSLGGWLAALYGVACGEKSRPKGNSMSYSGPDSLILVSPSGVFDGEESQKEWESIFRSAMTEGFPALRPHLFGNEPKWFRFIAGDFSKFISRDEVLQFMNSIREDHRLEKVVHRIQARVWLVWGVKDTLSRSRWAYAWLKCLRGEDLVDNQKHQVIFLENIGHSPHVEAPVVMAAALHQILSGKSSILLGRRWWRQLEKC